jgi:four helix bundle protein
MGIVATTSYSFALEIITMHKFLLETKKEYVISKQLLRSGTAIGALIKEAEHAQSRADFLHKMNISLKEANETEYWLMLLRDSGYISDAQYDKLITSCKTILRLLISIVRSTKSSIK